MEMLGFKFNPPINRTARKRRFITEDEFEKVLSFAKDKNESIRKHKLIATLCLMYYHGMRRSEVCDLTWTCVSITRGEIFIDRKKGGVSCTHPISQSLMPSLRYLRNWRIEGSPYVLCSHTGQKTKGLLLWEKVQRLNGKEIIDFKMFPHCFRHGCGYYLANKGVELRTIQAYLGHRSIQSTVIYTEISPKRFVGLWD